MVIWDRKPRGAKGVKRVAGKAWNMEKIKEMIGEKKYGCCVCGGQDYRVSNYPGPIPYSSFWCEECYKKEGELYKEWRKIHGCHKGYGHLPFLSLANDFEEVRKKLPEMKPIKKVEPLGELL